MNTLKHIFFFHRLNSNFIIQSGFSSTASIHKIQALNQIYFERSSLLNSITDREKYQTLYEKIPVVVLFGWAGSKDSHLLKYQQIYAKMGYHTIRFAPTTRLTFFHPEKHPKYVNRLQNIMIEHNLTRNALVTHLFSNAGLFIVYQHILANRNKKFEFFLRNQKSVVFDSAPGWPHHGFKAIRAVEELVKNSLPSAPMAPLRYLVAGTFVATAGAFHLANSSKFKYFIDAFDLLVNDVRPIPTLILYSNRDRLIPPENIQRVIEKRQSKGIAIDSVVYDDCEHVMIYLKHPDDYVKRINEHLFRSKMDLNTVLGDDLGNTKSRLIQN